MAGFDLRERCPACGSGAAATIFSRPFTDPSIWPFLERYYEGRIARREIAGRPYEIARCRLCGLLWQRFVLSEGGMQQLYEQWIHAEQSLAKRRARAAGASARAAREIEALASLVGRAPHETRVLDFGMGWGHWCAIARAYGFAAAGVELSEPRRKYAEGLGVEVHASLETIPRGSLDFCNAEQVFEHLPRPHETLCAIRDRLAARGIVRIAVPDARGYARRLARREWRAAKDPLQPLEHVNGFGRGALLGLARAAGLAPVPAPALAPPASGLRVAIRHALAQAWRRRCGTVVYLRRAEGA